ncbi:hypothetical protein OUZ56_027464 [Daphnia magna]|uniref:Uncharacterized protein n=1 Tax=Daphnia magna TaxID=35525 RepID=A0ABQ9ZPU7_9CRUS|nr:hypothetical protein OUZ56_027464 [Daphnia magna]
MDVLQARCQLRENDVMGGLDAETLDLTKQHSVPDKNTFRKSFFFVVVTKTKHFDPFDSHPAAFEFTSKNRAVAKS